MFLLGFSNLTLHGKGLGIDKCLKRKLLLHFRLCFLLLVPPWSALALWSVSLQPGGTTKPQSTNLCLEMMVQISNTSKEKANHQRGFTLVRPLFLSHICNWTPDCLGCPLMPSLMFPNFKKCLLFSFYNCFWQRELIMRIQDFPLNLMHSFLVTVNSF